VYSMRYRLSALLLLPLLLCGFPSVHLAGSGLSADSTKVCTLVGEDAFNFDDITGTGVSPPNFLYKNHGTLRLPYGKDAVCDTFKNGGLPDCPTFDGFLGVNATGSISFTGEGYQKGLRIADDIRGDFSVSNKFSVTFHIQGVSPGNDTFVFFHYASILVKTPTLLFGLPVLADEYRIGTAHVSTGVTAVCFGVNAIAGADQDCAVAGQKSTGTWAGDAVYHHMGFVWNGPPAPYTATTGTLTVYQDGVLVNQVTGLTGQMGNSAGYAAIGDTFAGGTNAMQWFRLDNLQIFHNKALTQPEVVDADCVVPTIH
jgi:hypothetical protein